MKKKGYIIKNNSMNKRKKKQRITISLYNLSKQN